MSKSTNSEYKTAIFSGFVAIVFTAIYDWVKEKPILSSLDNVLKWVWYNLFQFELAVWQILLLFIILILVKIFFKRNKAEDKNALDWLDYKKDTFDGLEWKWIWQKSVNKWEEDFSNWKIDDLDPICPKCGMEMNLRTYYSADCPRCDNYVSGIKPPHKIRSIIIDNVKRGLYK